MLRNLQLLSLVTLLSFATAGFAAEQKMLPGEWQHKFEVTSESGQFEQAMKEAKKAMESMPPEQRKMMEDMMKSQGVNLDFQSYTTTVCITEEDAKNNELPEPQGDCTQEISEETSDGYKIRYSCPGNPPVSGEGTIKFTDNKHFTSTITVETQMNNQPEQLTINQTGEWQAAQCSQ